MRTRHLSAVLAALTTLSLGALAAPSPARAEEPAARFQASLIGGAFFPTAQASDELAVAPLLGAQLSFDLFAWLGVVTSFQWIPTTASQLGDAAVDLYQYDLGLRAQHDFALGTGLAIRPEIGFGFGGRTVAFRNASLQDGTGFVWYSALGAELLWSSWAAGVTARHQTTSPNGTSLGDHTRTDVLAFGTLGYRF